MSGLDVQLGRQLVGGGGRDAGVGRRRLLDLGGLGGLLSDGQRVLGREILGHLLVLGEHNGEVRQVATGDL